MNDINAVFIVGRLTKDPELRYTQAGTAVCSFSIANNRTYVSAGEKKEQVSYFNCVAWAKLGDVIKDYCQKGHRVGITGRLQQRSWKDQNEKIHSLVEIVVENIQFLNSAKPENLNQAPDELNLPEGEDLPF
jgi:single-strand DNA-binding protein